MDFRELWIDQADALERIPAAASAETRGHLTEFITNGFTVYRHAVDPELADQVAREAHGIFKNPEKYVLKNSVISKIDYTNPAGLTKFRRPDRVSDIYGVSAAARKAIYQPGVVEFLNCIFGEPVLATQAVYFEYGSQQAMHQDTAYVVSKKPLSLAAAWLALEDIQPGSGELMYYPGSHRFEHFLFGGERKAWFAAGDGQAQHQRFLAQLHDQAERMGAKEARFLVKKGDILIWHADLAHGGSRATNLKTRRSLVTHFVPLSVKPSYSDKIGSDYYEYRYADGAYFASRHYAVKELEHSESARIVYDSGITTRRKRSA